MRRNPLESGSALGLTKGGEMKLEEVVIPSKAGLL